MIRLCELSNLFYIKSVLVLCFTQTTDLPTDTTVCNVLKTTVIVHNRLCLKYVRMQLIRILL